MKVIDAKAALRDAGFSVTVVQKYSHETPGTVMNVSETEGSRVVTGTPISITVAKTYPKVPNVVGMSQASAVNELKNAGYDVVVARQDSSASPGTVLAMSPSSGSELLPGRSVKVVVATKPPPPPPSNCTPGYSPCLVDHGGADYDCAGGSGNGPYYTKPGVAYRVTGYDPYGLDSDNDGYGCE
jgi:beta-lactam-binding protein with PASTA domain